MRVATRVIFSVIFSSNFKQPAAIKFLQYNASYQEYITTMNINESGAFPPYLEQKTQQSEK
jgi:hypothetical protein